MFDNCQFANTNITVEYDGRRTDAALYLQVTKPEFDQFLSENLEGFQEVTPEDGLRTNIFGSFSTTVIPDNPNLPPVRIKVVIDMRKDWDEEVF